MALYLDLDGDLKSAIAHYRVAAESGDPVAHVLLGTALLRSGDQSGHEWIDRAMMLPNASAWATRADHLLKGEFLDQNTEDGLIHLKEAYRLGRYDLADTISAIYLFGLFGQESDFPEAEKWATKLLPWWQKLLASVNLLPVRLLYKGATNYKLGLDYVTSASGEEVSKHLSQVKQSAFNVAHDRYK